METQRENGFHPYYDIRLNQDGRAVSCTRRPHFTPQGNCLVVISVRGRVDPRATECGQKDCHLKKDPAGNRTQDLAYCGAVRQPAASSCVYATACKYISICSRQRWRVTTDIFTVSWEGDAKVLNLRPIHGPGAWIQYVLIDCPKGLSLLLCRLRSVKRCNFGFNIFYVQDGAKITFLQSMF